MGAVHPRPGGLRHQCRRADSAAIGRRCGQPALSPSAPGDDGRDVAAARRLWPGLAGSGTPRWTGIMPIRRPSSRPSGNGTTSSAGFPGSTRSSCPAAIRATRAPAVLMPFLARVAEVLHRSHPRATLWVSPQGFNQEWLDQFLEILNAQELPWLTGIVHGPQVRISMADAAQGRAVALPDSHLSRHHPQPAMPVPGSRLGPGLLAHRGARGHQPPARGRGGHLPLLPARLDRLHQLFRGLQRRRQQVRLERPGLGPGRRTWSTCCGNTAGHSSARRSPTNSPRGCWRSRRTGRALAAARLGREDVPPVPRAAADRQCQNSLQLAVPAGALPSLLRQLRPEAADRGDPGRERGLRAACQGPAERVAGDDQGCRARSSTGPGSVSISRS